MASPVAEPDRDGLPLLEIFSQLSRLRVWGLGGPEPLQPGMIRDWCQLTRTVLAVEEIRIILAIDATWLAAWRREAETQEEE